MACSMMLHTSGDYLFGKCLRGKLVRKGVRQPFFWAVPRYPFYEELLFENLVEIADRMHRPTFLIPTRARAQRFLPARWLPRPMSNSSSGRLVKEVMARAGVPRDEVQKLCFNSCRRFLPTVGNVLQLPRHTCQAIGNWVEVEVKDQAEVPPSTHVRPLFRRQGPKQRYGETAGT